MLIYSDIEQSLSAFNFKVIQECRTLLLHIEQYNLNVADIIEYIDEVAKLNIRHEKQLAITKPRSAEKVPYMPICPACSKSLKLRESEIDKEESVFFCVCGYEYHNEISVTDHQMIIRAKMQGKEPDFSIEELRASREERKQRRVICEKCKYLTQQKTCKACGCRMKHRTYYKILTCPKKFW